MRAAQCIMLREYHMSACSNPVADDNAAVYEVFRAHFDQIVKGITGLTSLVSILYSKQLITDTLKTNLTTVTGIGDVDKAIKLINAVEITMMSAPKASLVLLNLCSALDQEPALKCVVDKIRSELGRFMYTHDWNLSDGGLACYCNINFKIMFKVSIKLSHNKNNHVPGAYLGF